MVLYAEREREVVDQVVVIVVVVDGEEFITKVVDKVFFCDSLCVCGVYFVKAAAEGQLAAESVGLASINLPSPRALSRGFKCKFTFPADTIVVGTC